MTAIIITLISSAIVLFANKTSNPIFFYQNLEALADPEGGSISECYSEYTFHLTKRVLACGDCTIKWGRGTTIGGICSTSF